jgi:hypothetical protein
MTDRQGVRRAGVAHTPLAQMRNAAYLGEPAAAGIPAGKGP